MCCYDFGLQHILGNLITLDYNSLFTGETFQKLKQGLNDDSIESLCRYCENASIIDDYEHLNRKKIINIRNDFLKIVRSIFHVIHQ